MLGYPSRLHTALEIGMYFVPFYLSNACTEPPGKSRAIHPSKEHTGNKSVVMDFKIDLVK